MKNPSRIGQKGSPRARVPQAPNHRHQKPRTKSAEDTKPTLAMFHDGLDGDSQDIIHLSAEEFEAIDRAAAAAGVSPGLYIAEAGIEKSRGVPAGRNVICVFQSETGKRLARVAFPYEAFLQICRASSLLDVSIPKFFSIALATACQDAGLLSASERRSA